MAFWQRLIGRAEQRAAIEDPNVPLSAPNVIQALGWDFAASATGVNVTTESALTVPAVWAAVNFMSGTLAGLPLHVYRRTSGGDERIAGGLSTILHDAPNDEMSSFEWRKYTFDQVFTGGRGFSFIEKNAASKVMNIWPLDPGRMKVVRTDGRKRYVYKDGREKVYEAHEIIDVPFMLKADGLSHRGPIATGRDAIGLAIAATQYGSKFFQNGGVPPFAIEGPFQSPAALQRAANDLADAVKVAAKENRQALALPAGHTIKSLGVDLEKAQLVELQRFCIEQIARIYSLPPVFLQDLTHGTFSNTEQQDLHFVKHAVKRWVEQFEQEMNLKLFGRGGRQYVGMNLDGLMRGDLTSRMNAHAVAIQNAIRTPDEVRGLENLPAKGGAADKLHIQGATVPIGTNVEPTEGKDPAPAGEEGDDDA